MISQNRVALVTGSSSGIGSAVANAFASSGYNLVINYSSSAERAKETLANCEKLGSEVVSVRCDVSNEKEVLQLVSICEQRFGRLDVLVNNAGTTMNVPPKKIDEVDLDEWDRVFAVNVRGMFQVSRAARNLLKESDNAAIINMCSVAGLRPGPQPFAYAASKAAVANLTKTLAGFLGPEIRVNALAPGWLEGDWMEQMLGDNYEGLMSRRAKYTPLKRVATATDVGEVAVNLAENNKFVTGEIITIDGGFTSTT